MAGLSIKNWHLKAGSTLQNWALVFVLNELGYNNCENDRTAGKVGNQYNIATWT